MVLKISVDLPSAVLAGLLLILRDHQMSCNFLHLEREG